MTRTVPLLLLLVSAWPSATAAEPESLPALKSGAAPGNFNQMWSGFDPRAEPLEIETLKQWQEDGAALRIVRFRIGVFKGKVARLAAIYGFPIEAAEGKERLPGLLQIHGGGQYADHRACVANAKRGYATLSIAWAGRISAPDYRVSPSEVQLFWDGKVDDPNYRLTTDWGAVDGYHAPGRNPGNNFPSAKAAEWTLDEVESPRNSGWFLCALAARRALTFLEQQPEVDPDRLGVYGHSMGGKLTVMSSVDERVKAAAPSCGGISDRGNDSALFRATIGDDVSLRQIDCPIVFLSPANDFHGRVGDLPASVDEIKTDQWRVTCSPHLNHRDTPAHEVATLLWFDQHLKGEFEFPRTPATELKLKTADGVPSFTVTPDRSQPILAVDVFYTQQGKANETRFDIMDARHRFWHHAVAVESDGIWQAKLPLHDTDRPLWVYANVLYPLDEAVSGVGYYYGAYTADSFNVSSLIEKVSPAQLAEAGVKAVLEPSLLIEDFQGDWAKQWFKYDPNSWACITNKPNDDLWKAPSAAKLALEVQASEANKLVVLIGDHAAEVELAGGPQWQAVELTPSDFHNVVGEGLSGWDEIRQLKLSPREHLRPGRGQQAEVKVVGAVWKGDDPSFRNLRWQTQ